MLIKENAIITITMGVFSYNENSHHGWTDGINEFYSFNKIIMPEKNLTLFSIFHKYHKISY